MALDPSTIWEVRSGGLSTNGGAFVVGAAGTDYSQQASPHVTFDGSSITASSSGISATITLTGYTVASTDAGNILQITGGTNYTPGFYQIVSVNTGSNTWTLDRNAETGVGAAMTGAMGGAVDIATAAAQAVASNKVWVKADGTYALTAGLTISAGSITPSQTAAPNWWVGYGTTRGDGQRASIVLSTNTGITAMNFSNVGGRVENFDINCSSLGTSSGIAVAYQGLAFNCKVYNFTSRGITFNSDYGAVVFCEVTGGTSAASGAIFNGSGGYATVVNCYVHDNACPGIRGCPKVCFNLVCNNSGASSMGIDLSLSNGGIAAEVCNNTVFNSGSHGIQANLASWYSMSIRNNIVANNGGFGIVGGTGSSGWPSLPEMDGNAYYANASGPRSLMDNKTNLTFQSGPYTTQFDIYLTASPFMNTKTGDFSLNNLSNGGARLQNVIYSALPGFPPVPFTFGAIQPIVKNGVITHVHNRNRRSKTYLPK